MTKPTTRKPPARRHDEPYAKVRSGARLRKLRKAKRLSLRSLAFLVGAPNSYTMLGAMERGTIRTCSVRLATEIAYRLDRELEDLFDVVEPPFRAVMLARRNAAIRAA